jgi:CheY-like chemotaxis protein
MVGMWNVHRCTQDRKPPAGGGRVPVIAGEAAGTAAPLLRKVLVVDDEADLADMAAALLSAHGLEVVVAYSGHQAVEALANNDDIDAIFSDIVMPGMTGLELADAVREMYPKIKIVLASGYTRPSLLQNRERPYLFTTKPYAIDRILTLLRS